MNSLNVAQLAGVAGRSGAGWWTHFALGAFAYAAAVGAVLACLLNEELSVSMHVVLWFGATGVFGAIRFRLRGSCCFLDCPSPGNFPADDDQRAGAESLGRPVPRSRWGAAKQGIAAAVLFAVAAPFGLALFGLIVIGAAATLLSAGHAQGVNSVAGASFVLLGNCCETTRRLSQ